MSYNNARNQIYRVIEGGTGNHIGGGGRDRNRTDPCFDKGRGPLIYSLWGLPSDLHASRVPSSLGPCCPHGAHVVSHHGTALGPCGISGQCDLPEVLEALRFSSSGLKQFLLWEI